MKSLNKLNPIDKIFLKPFKMLLEHKNPLTMIYLTKKIVRKKDFLYTDFKLTIHLQMSNFQSSS